MNKQNKEVIIRKAREEDLKDLAELDKQFWEIHKNISPFIKPSQKLTSKSYIKHAKGNLRERKQYFYVAEKENRVIGAITFKIKKQDKFFKIRKYGYIDTITIDTEHRKSGIGKLLINFVLKFMKKKKIKYIKFHTNWENKNAIEAFRKMNFKEKTIVFYKEIK